jgi:hypothetical protein
LPDLQLAPQQVLLSQQVPVLRCSESLRRQQLVQVVPSRLMQLERQRPLRV